MPFLPVLQSAAASGAGLASMLPIVLIFVIFYFFLIRPQNKKQKDTEKMISALKKGDKVVTIGGIHGVVSSTKEKTVIIKVDDNTKLEFSRSAVASVVTDEKDKTDKKDKADKKAIEKEETISDIESSEEK